MEFKFHPELFEYRAQIMEVLAAAEIWWLVDFRTIDLDHSEYLIEVDGIPDEKTAWRIANVVAGRFRWGVLGYEKYAGDWLIVIVLRRGHGIHFGRDEGGRSGGMGFEIAPADPNEEVGGKEDQPTEADEDGPADPGDPDGTPEDGPLERADSSQSIPLIGGVPMRTKRLATCDELRRFAQLLQALSRPDSLHLVEVDAPVHADRGPDGDQQWDGQVRVTVRLQDIKVSIAQVRQIVQLLAARTDLLDLLEEGLLTANRDRVDGFLGDLPPQAAEEYEPLACYHGVVHPGLTIVSPTQGESWRLTFSVHVSSISRVLNGEMQRLAAEGAALVGKKG